MGIPQSTGQERYLSGAGSAAASWFVSNGRITPAALVAGTPANGNLALFSVKGRSGAIIQFIGQGSDNGTYAYRLWGVKEIKNPSTNQVEELDIENIGSGTAQLSTATGAPSPTANPAARVATTSDRFADIISYADSSPTTTPKGPTTLYQAALSDAGGGNQAYGTSGHALGNIPAKLICGSIYRYDSIIIEFNTLSSVTAANAVIEGLEV